METPQAYVKKALRIVGGIAVVAREFGISYEAARKWKEIDPKTGMPKIPPTRCRRIEELTGGQVTREQMRPDIFGAADAQEVA